MSNNLVKRRCALSLLAKQPILSLQVLNEVANVMRRKLDFTISNIRKVLLCWLRESRLHPMTPSTLLLSLDIADRFGFSHYDSLIIAAALEADCTVLYSEDLQHGQLINQRMKIINPFLQQTDSGVD